MWVSSIRNPPWAPGKPVVRDVAKTSLTLAWTRPEHDGGAKIEGYIIEFQKTGSEEWIHIADGVPQTEHQLKGLKEKQEYSFRVKAVNKAGESEPSEPSDPVVCKERLCESWLCVFMGKNHINKLSLNQQLLLFRQILHLHLSGWR
uniref:Fibronectin type-III domain-containing protein n=1 Tax=Salarias fasciatus TaxID=181472 RepID=A0A672IAS2_SALFA